MASGDGITQISTSVAEAVVVGSVFSTTGCSAGFIRMERKWSNELVLFVKARKL